MSATPPPDAPAREVRLDDVRAFWESHPLFTGESAFPAGTREFFEEHLRVTVDDCFAGELDPRMFPRGPAAECVLDLGCGPGTWSVELKRRGARRVVAADLTDAALALTSRRAALFGFDIETSRQNAEALTFADASFTHVNCLGVIHHTPDTAACVREMARVLEPGGTAVIAVYHRNLLLTNWWWLRQAARGWSWSSGGLKGRGRERILETRSADELVRRFDGDANPLGKAFTTAGFYELLRGDFVIEETFLHFFPARGLPLRLPRALHRQLDRRFGFLIYATCRKRDT